jgi:DNA-binding response OmpR family regulator
VARGHDLGVDWYQTKPFQMADLLLIIRRVLDAGAGLPESPEP